MVVERKIGSAGRRISMQNLKLSSGRSRSGVSSQQNLDSTCFFLNDELGGLMMD